jgi:hypothetical protein
LSTAHAVRDAYDRGTNEMTEVVDHAEKISGMIEPVC